MLKFNTAINLALVGTGLLILARIEEIVGPFLFAWMIDTCGMERLSTATYFGILAVCRCVIAIVGYFFIGLFFVAIRTGRRDRAKYCVKCGRVIGRDDKFCSSCGSSIVKSINNEVFTSEQTSGANLSLAAESHPTDQYVVVARKRSFFSYEGRSGRGEYWGVVCCFAVPSVLLIALAALLLKDNFKTTEGFSAFVVILSVIIGLLLLPFTLPVSVRRLHDLDTSGWLMALFIVGGWIPILKYITGTAQFILMGCMRGTAGPNKYGPDSLGSRKQGASVAQDEPPRTKDKESPDQLSPFERFLERSGAGGIAPSSRSDSLPM